MSVHLSPEGTRTNPRLQDNRGGIQVCPESIRVYERVVLPRDLSLFWSWREGLLNRVRSTRIRHVLSLIPVHETARGRRVSNVADPFGSLLHLECGQDAPRSALRKQFCPSTPQTLHNESRLRGGSDEIAIQGESQVLVGRRRKQGDWEAGPLPIDIVQDIASPVTRLRRIVEYLLLAADQVRPG